MLNLEWFRSRAEAKVLIERWRQFHSERRPPMARIVIDLPPWSVPYADYLVTSAPVNPALIAGSSRFSTRLARTSPVLST